jgi:cytochrome c oxidase subunit 2
MTARSRRTLAATALLALCTILLSGCARHALQQDSLSAAGPIARKENNLFWPVFWVAVFVFVLVEGLVVVAAIRFRHRPGRAVPKQVHGNTRLELTWTAIPAILLAGISIPTIATIFSLAAKPANALPITVTGHQWWWEVQYPTYHFTTANEIHIPARRPVYVTLKAYDVIHSFWIPRLAGKQDLEPGRVNHLTIQADGPGRYFGQCAEFCGTSHANMRFRVFADNQSGFMDWVHGEQQRAGPPPPSTLAIMQAKGCGGCHTINGVEGFVGVIGPNLTHFASRTSFAGSTFPNNAVNLRHWLADPPGVKPGADMPNLHLTPQQIDALIAYLQSRR